MTRMMRVINIDHKYMVFSISDPPPFSLGSLFLYATSRYKEKERIQDSSLCVFNDTLSFSIDYQAVHYWNKLDHDDEL